MLTSATVKSRIKERRKETVKALGDEVVVRAINTGEFLSLEGLDVDSSQYAFIYAALSICVVGGDGKPLMTRQEWENYAASQEGKDDVIKLYEKFRELNDHLFDRPNEKN